jgi:hypothetical protein
MIRCLNYIGHILPPSGYITGMARPRFQFSIKIILFWIMPYVALTLAIWQHIEGWQQRALFCLTVVWVNAGIVAFDWRLARENGKRPAA